MKPNFALTLSFEGIGLLHRAFPGWHLVGEVALDSPDLTDELAALRSKALTLDASGLRSKLVIPNDQIKYLQFDAEGADADEIAAAVQRHMDGGTPYAWDDLACDWSVSAGQVFVAAVARETLAEAETFAADHKFNPLSFVAIPDGRDFVGEPWFGQTSIAAAQLANGEQVERDTAAIRVIGAAHLPEPGQRDADEPMPTPAPELPAAAPPAPEAPAPDDTAGTTAPDNETPPESDVWSQTDDAADTASAAPQAPPSEPQDTEEPVASAPAFSSIRARRDDLPAVTPRLSGARRDDAPAQDPDAADTPTTDSARPEPPLTAAPPEPAVAAEVTGVPEDGLPEEVVSQLAASLHADPDDMPAGRPADAAPPGRAEDKAPSFFTRRSIRLKRGGSERQERRSAGTQPLAPEDEKQRMTVFGAREPVRVGGKPRFLGVILTAVLLLFLVGVAAWASIFMDDGLARFLRDDADSQIAATPEADVTDPALIEQDEADETADDPVVASLSQPESDIATDARPDPAPAELSSDEARARYAATGIWQMAPDAPTPPEMISLDDFYLTSIDPKVIEQDAIALPDGQALLRDARPETPPDPPAAGTLFDLDSRGFVRATPEGALTTDGVRVFAGRPPVVPPGLPERAAAAPEVTDPAETAAPQEASLRPKARPGDLSEQNERSTLGGRTRTELAGLRPELRPKSIQELAEEAAAASAAAEAETPDPGDPDAIDEAVAAAVQTPDPFAGATQQAVAASLKPKTRPRNFDSIVKRSEETVTATRVPTSQRAQPSAPTATTVARAATENNALKLRRVNLIGVYGTPSNRRALVRLANGRYKKVKVGDRLDGGRVNAIGDSELRYVKGGRNVTLTMPRG
jgi:hypothetical protein